MTDSFLNTDYIFIVDDDADIALTFKIALEMKGFNVDMYTDPIIALSQFKPDYYSLLLLDIRMPKMTGFELYYKIAKVDNKVKVCFITAFESYYESLKKSYPSLDVDCFIKKPIDVNDLVSRIKKRINSN